MQGRSEPKTLLARLIGERGLSYESAASDIEALALRERIDGTITSRHLQRLARRERPDATTRAGTQELLSRYFDQSFEALVAPLDDPADLGSLVVADLAGRTISGALPDPSRLAVGYLFGDHPDPAEPLQSPAAATRIRDFSAAFMRLDLQHGGGAIRKSLLHFFHDDVVPCLALCHSETTRRDVFGAAAEAARLLGWTAYDTGQHVAATRYLAHGLDLAKEAGDRAQGAWILGLLSHQANFLGQFTDAVMLARAGQQAISNPVGAVRASLLATEARALASSGDRTTCVRVLAQAEAALARSDPSIEPPWMYYFDIAEMAGEAAHCFRDLGQGDLAEEMATTAIDPVLTPQRTRSFVELVCASAALKSGDLDRALSLGRGALEVVANVSSQRSRSYVETFKAELIATHPRHPGVIEYVAQ
ncbi:MAG: hypothetical protein ACRCYU_23350 [Nocardioides sp.]